MHRVFSHIIDISLRHCDITDDCLWFYGSTASRSWRAACDKCYITNCRSVFANFLVVLQTLLAALRLRGSQHLCAALAPHVVSLPVFSALWIHLFSDAEQIFVIDPQHSWGRRMLPHASDIAPYCAWQEPYRARQSAFWLRSVARANLNQIYVALHAASYLVGCVSLPQALHRAWGVGKTKICNDWEGSITWSSKSNHEHVTKSTTTNFINFQPENWFEYWIYNKYQNNLKFLLIHKIRYADFM